MHNTNRWLQLRLESQGALIVFATALLLVISREPWAEELFPPISVGLCASTSNKGALSSEQLLLPELGTDINQHEPERAALYRPLGACPPSMGTFITVTVGLESSQ